MTESPTSAPSPFVLPRPEVAGWRAAARALRRAWLRARLGAAPLARKKEWNSRLNWREFWHGRTRLASFPRVIQVGTNWTCNLQCAFCRLTMPWTRQELARKPPSELQLSPAALEAVRRLLPYAEMMTLTPLGEPLLWSGLKDLLEYHARIGSHNLALTSNGMLLKDAMAERLVRGQLSALYLSVDSNDPQVYASMRVGGELAQVEEGIRRVRHWKERLGVPWPRVTINATFMARNIGQLPSMVDWARALGAEALSVQLMEMENPELEAEFLGHHPEQARQALEAALDRGRQVGLNVQPHPALLGLIQQAAAGGELTGASRATSPSIPGRTPVAPAAPAASAFPAGPPLVQRCSLPWHNLMIDTDGEARPCCWADVSWGNLNRDGFDEIWNSRRACAMRQAFLKNCIPPSCRNKHCRVDL